MHGIWDRIKPIVKKTGVSEETLSFIKERVLLLGGIPFGKPLPYRHQLPILLQYLGLTGEGVEIGVRNGAYSEILLEYGPLKTLHSIDPWKEYSVGEYDDGSNVTQVEQDKLFKDTTKRLEKYGARSKMLRQTSLEASQQFNKNSLEFIYIDANHSYEACKEDIKLWWPKLKEGGVFAGHDYLNGIISHGVFGVKRAVDEFARKEKQKVFVTPERWPTWFCIKNVPEFEYTAFASYALKHIRSQYRDKKKWRKSRGIRSS